MDRRELANDHEEAFRLALDGRLACLWTSFPGIVQSVNWAQMTCVVQPAIQGSITDENNNTTFVNLPVLVDCPIVFQKAGGFVLTLPIAAHDEVLVSIANRCIDAWWQSGGIQQPVEYRMHDLSDGFVIPGPCSLPNVIPNISPTDAQLRNKAGTAVIGIAPSGAIYLTSAISTTVNGNLVVTGSVTATGQVTANSVPLSIHTHPVSTAPGTTGVPNP